jgi:hypothetical protein
MKKEENTTVAETKHGRGADYTPSVVCLDERSGRYN